MKRGERPGCNSASLAPDYALGEALQWMEQTAARLAAKTTRLRIFDDQAGLMNLALADVGGAVLAVSQFTLYADARRGNRPSFTEAAGPEHGERLYTVFIDALRAANVPVRTGTFGAHMRVELVNDGPVTIMLEG